MIEPLPRRTGRPTARLVRRGSDGRPRLPSWRWEALRTTFWLVPTSSSAFAGLLFLATFVVDLAAYHHHFTLPAWINAGSADAGRQVLIAIAAAVITVVGVVFSITILALTLASQQFGPRMMRNFVRDVGNQVTLGVFVATFVYAVLALGSIASDARRPVRPAPVDHRGRGALARGPRRPHLLHPSHRQVDPVARGDRRHRPRSPARHRRRVPRTNGAEPQRDRHRSAKRQVRDGAARSRSTNGAGSSPPIASGYLQFVGYAQLVDIAARIDAVIRLNHRPGPLRRGRPPAGHGLAAGSGAAGRAGSRRGPRDRARTAP